MIDNRGPVIRPSLRDHNNMVQQHIGIRVLRNQNVGGDHVARMQFAQNVRILQFVGHGHRVHEARNRLMVQRHLALGRVGRNHLPAQLVHLEVLAGGRIGAGFRRRVAPRQHNHNEQ